ncbi:hypothetical protein [Kutzneria sp. NPDC052558]|uniref:hypothetical protein n=1 Tax=Kutzneria sp. NPDC052558 TaxID=3364121 RepID=UPI0037C8F9A7
MPPLAPAGIWRDLTAGESAACPLYRRQARRIAADYGVFCTRIARAARLVDQLRQQNSARYYVFAVLDYQQQLVDNIDLRAPDGRRPT